jgi:hypothetical protein
VYLLVRISFDPNVIYCFSALIVGHFYVTFVNHVSPPCFLLFRYFSVISVYFSKFTLFSFSVIVLCIGDAFLLCAVVFDNHQCDCFLFDANLFVCSGIR